MSDDNTQDGAEPSLASAGSVDELGPVPRATDTGIRLSLLRWIPVTERLPEVHSPVLVSITESRYPAVATMSIDGEWLFREGDHVTVTHWMPLPPPPETSK
jgi:hypothetical protein